MLQRLVRASRYRLLALSLPLIVAVALVGCLLWWPRGPSAQAVGPSTAYLVEGRTAISSGRPMWICTYADGTQEFERSHPVTGGTCPMRVESDVSPQLPGLRAGASARH
jgi:hypothetical protein